MPIAGIFWQKAAMEQFLEGPLLADLCLMTTAFTVPS